MIAEQACGRNRWSWATCSCNVAASSHKHFAVNQISLWYQSTLELVGMHIDTCVHITATKASESVNTVTKCTGGWSNSLSGQKTHHCSSSQMMLGLCNMSWLCKSRLLSECDLLKHMALGSLCWVIQSALLLLAENIAWLEETAAWCWHSIQRVKLESRAWEAESAHTAENSK